MADNRMGGSLPHMGMMQGLGGHELSVPNAKAEPLEHNPDLGVYLKQTKYDGRQTGDIYFAQFSPKMRLLASGGIGPMASLWDLRSDNHNEFREAKMPHVQSKDWQEHEETAVSSIHWNAAGDRLVTSSQD